MTENLTRWEVGKTYLTSSGLCVLITTIKNKNIPLNEYTKYRLDVDKTQAIEGVVWSKTNPNFRVRGSWNIKGKHSIDGTPSIGDLTLEEVR